MTSEVEVLQEFGKLHVSLVLYNYIVTIYYNYNSTVMKGTKSANPRRRALAIRMRYMHVYAVLLLVGWSKFFIQLVVAYHLAESLSLACYTTR